MKETEQVLLELTARALFGVRTDLNPDAIDWPELYAECDNQALTILIWDTLSEKERSCIPEELSLLWEQNAMLHMMNNEQLLYEQEQVIGYLSEAGIPCVILKGSSSAACYPVPALRNMGDIDLLVDPGQQMEAVRILQEHGYGDVRDERHHCHMTVSKGNISVEVHREPNGLSINENTESLRKIRGFFDDSLRRRQFVDGLPVLADDQQAVSLIIHKIEHFLTSGLGLRQLCDWAVFVDQKLNHELWQNLEPKLAEFGILYFTGVITKACVEYLHLPETSAPWCMEYDSETARRVIEQILDEGNFGRKADKYGERLFSNPNASNRLTSFFRVLTSVCRDRWPIFTRHPILMPIAPFMLLGRYLNHRIKGKRPQLNLIRKYRRSGADQQLYRSLKPFIPDGNEKGRE